jgi:hypothetical protein
MSIPPDSFTSGYYNPPASGLQGGYFPQINPIYPYTLPADAFNLLVDAYGQNMLWCKNHLCPCTSYPTSTNPAGSPNPVCQTCHGRGIYWETNPVPFIGLLTFGHHLAGTGIEPGAVMDPRLGNIQEGQPWLSMTQFAGVVWEEASEFDIFVESDAAIRFSTTLTSGPSGILHLPYQQSLVVAATGAVTTWDPSTGTVVPVTGYVVSGTTVTIPDSYPANTPYVVAFTAAPAYVAFRGIGGMPHTRPFVRGALAYPRRFRLQPLDLWLREQTHGAFGNPGAYGP